MRSKDKDTVLDGSEVTDGFKVILSQVYCRPNYMKSLLSVSANTQDLTIELHFGIWKVPKYSEEKIIFAHSPHLHRLS